MAHTTSLAFPNMFDPTVNKVSVLSDNASVVSRTRLLMLTNPTELYNEPTFGLGLKRYLWQYNNENVKAMIQDRLKDQLREFEPCVTAESTQFSDGLLFTESATMPTAQEFNQLKMTVGLQTTYKDDVVVDLSDIHN